jgi:hypothetical protein
LTITDSKSRSRTKGRLLRALAMIAAIAAGLITAAAAPALAETGQKCTAQTASNVCLSIYPVDSDHFKVLVGIDFHISRQRAQEIIDQPGDPFNTRIFGVAREPVGNQALFTVPEIEIGASEDFGLSAGFESVVTKDQLNDDGRYPSPFQNDKVFGRIILTQSHGPTLTFDTPRFKQNF